MPELMPAQKPASDARAGILVTLATRVGQVTAARAGPFAGLADPIRPQALVGGRSARRA